jgi:hypothetical protein
MPVMTKELQENPLRMYVDPQWSGYLSKYRKAAKVQAYSAMVLQMNKDTGEIHCMMTGNVGDCDTCKNPKCLQTVL